MIEHIECKHCEELAFRLKQAINYIEARTYGGYTPRYDVTYETVYGIRMYSHKAIKEYEDEVQRG